MKLTILGSGTCVIRPDYFGPAFLLELGDELLLLDCAWGSGLQVINAGYRIEDLDHILISHPHPDHMGNLLSILQSMMVSGFYYPETQRNKPLYLHGYHGFEQDYESLRSMMFPERKETYEIIISEYTDNQKKIADLVINSQVVRHKADQFTSVGFRLGYQDQILAYTGDTGFDESLVTLLKSADIAIVEAGVPPQIFREKGPQPNHLSAVEAGKLSQQAGVKRLVLNHRYHWATDEEVVSQVRKHYDGEVFPSYDLQVITT